MELLHTASEFIDALRRHPPPRNSQALSGFRRSRADTLQWAIVCIVFSIFIATAWRLGALLYWPLVITAISPGSHAAGFLAARTLGASRATAGTSSVQRLKTRTPSAARRQRVTTTRTVA